MDELPSAQFRTQYAKLKEPTLVTVNGHPIGVWTPASELARAFDSAHPATPVDLARVPGGGLQARQAQRDDLLRKINRGK